MTLSRKAFTAVGATMFLGVALASSASASYMGYANGDPGNWDFYQEQHNGASPPDEAVLRPAYANSVGPRHVHASHRISPRAEHAMPASER